MLRLLQRLPKRATCAVAFGASMACLSTAAPTFVHTPGDYIMKDPSKLAHGSSMILTFDNAQDTNSFSQTPLRMAISATGISKAHAVDVRMNGRVVPQWNSVDINNMAVPGVDNNDACGEDALVFSHISRGATESSLTSKTEQYSSFPLFDAADAFAVNGLPLPVSFPKSPSSGALLGVADGVGGMVEYSDNETALMSHELMRRCGQSLNQNSTNAKEILQQGWDSLLSSDKISIGSTTAVLAHVTPDTKSPNHLAVSFANLGDSVCVVFRPVFHQLIAQNSNSGTTPYEGMNGFTPLAMSWPTYHHRGGSAGNLPPVQLTIFTKDESDPTSVKKSSLIDDSILYTSRFSSQSSDIPWMAQEGFTKVQRGDLVLVFSDGIADNLRVENFSYLVHLLYENVLNAFNSPEKVPFFLHGAAEAANAKVNAASASSKKSKKTPEQVKLPEMDRDLESVLAGNASSLLASSLVRYCQTSWKIDDMSVVVGIVH